MMRQDDRKKMTEFDFVRLPNSTAETCKMIEFTRTVNLNRLSLTEIKVTVLLICYLVQGPPNLRARCKALLTLLLVP